MAVTTHGTNVVDIISTDTAAGVDDIVYGYGANDTINAGSGINTYDGGFGTDTVNFNVVSGYAGPALSVIANLTSGTAVAKFAAGAAMDSSDTLVSIENLKGTTGDDKLTGDANANKLEGLAGDDVLNGMAGNDNLQGAAGEDILTGGKDKDTMNGGADSDTYNWKAGDGVDAITDSGTTGVDTIAVTDASDYTGLSATFGPANGIEEITGTTNIDGSGAKVNWNFSKTDLNGAMVTLGDWAGNKVVGSTAADTIDGGELKDTLNGGNGDDNLYGNGGNDVLNGQNGVDDLFGHAGNDTMNGGSGNDYLDGGAGVDSYTGGTGNDTFAVVEGQASSDTALADVITDFQGVGMTLGNQDTVLFDTTDGSGSLWVALSLSATNAILGFADSSGLASYVNLTVETGTIAGFMANTSGEWSFV